MALKDIFIQCLVNLKNTGINFKYANIWNEQIKEMINGQGYSIPSPAVFVEIMPNEGYSLPQGIVSYTNCRIRVHIYHQQLDGGQGKMEADYTVFDISKKVRKKFNILKLDSCSHLQLIEDNPDYDHGNEYNYVLGYVTNWIDLSGSIYDDPNYGTITDYTFGIIQKYITPEDDDYVDADGNSYIKDLS